jgi:hypothetical protein
MEMKAIGSVLPVGNPSKDHGYDGHRDDADGQREPK